MAMVRRRRQDKRQKCRITIRDVHELIEREFCQLNRKVDLFMATVTERLKAVGTKLDKIANETGSLKSLIAELRVLLEQGDGLTAEEEAALVEVETKAQSVDELVDDAVPEPEPEG